MKTYGISKFFLSYQGRFYSKAKISTLIRLRVINLSSFKLFLFIDHTYRKNLELSAAQ